jgi:nitrate reductase gamma subunit
MSKHISASLGAVLGLCLIAWLGTGATGLHWFFGIVVPYLGFLIFIGGFIWKIVSWSKSPVPFRIATTCGQQKSLPWIQNNNIESPYTKGGVFKRMLLEVALFRSLLRNTVMSVRQTPLGNRLVYAAEIFLWAGALAFHYAMLVVIIRHLRFFLQPVPAWLQIVENVDGFFRIEVFGAVFAIGLPGVMVSGLVFFAAAVFLLARRLANAKVRYISLASDYFPLFLLIAIGFTGIQMRYFTKVDIVGVKELTLGFASFQPVLPEGIGSIFYIHLFLVSVLFAYLPFSKLMHLGGVFLSPTRNLTADTRMNRHINPWNPKVETHSYEAYENEFREKMLSVGLPVDKKE